MSSAPVTRSWPPGDAVRVLSVTLTSVETRAALTQAARPGRMTAAELAVQPIVVAGDHTKSSSARTPTASGMSSGYTRLVVKIAVSIPEDLFAVAEAEARRRGMSRSALYAEALRQLTTSRTTIDEAIVAGYRRHPQEHDLAVEDLVSMTDDLGEYPS